jgi:PAS domain S-box-containing protein
MNPSPIHLLLVEDNEPDARLLKHTLADVEVESFRVTHVELMADAVRRLARDRFDAILLDLSLPDSRGVGTVAHVNAAAPHLPIVVLTGLDNEETGVEAVRQGAQDYLVKGHSDGRLLTRAIRYAMERKRTEEELKSAQAETLNEKNRLEAVMEALPVGVAILDTEGGNIRWNPMFDQVWGSPRPVVQSIGEYALYKAWWADTGRPVQPEEWASARAVTKGEAVLGQEVQIERFDGSRAFVLNSAAPVFDALGNIVGCTVAILDITDRKQAEDALKKLNETLEQQVAERTAVATRRAAQLQRLAAELTQTEHRERRRLGNILHDHLQQLLYAARLNLGTLRRGDLQDPARTETIDRIDALLGECIAESRALTVQLCPPVLYESGLVMAVEWLGRYMEQTCGLNVDVDADPQAEPQSEEIRILLYEAARELLFNVVKHAETGRARLSLTVPGDGQVCLQVSDEGAGFAPADSSAQNTISGFGLFSIRERLELLGGSLHIDSTPGSGTCATITAPVSSPGSSP